MIPFAFLLGMIALYLQGIIYPTLPILAFSPFLALASLKSPFAKALWTAALAGALVDLVSDHPMGLHALNYVLATAILHRYKKHLSFDQPFHFSLYTALFSSLSTALQFILLFLFDRRVPHDGQWILIDIFGLPAIDALYGFVWFAAPLALFERLRKLWVLFWLKRKNRSQTSH